MEILHKIDDFLFELFPKAKEGTNKTELLIEELTKYYAYGPYSPKITIDNDWVKIEIDTNTIVTQENDYRKVVSLCEKGNYKEAKKILEPLIKKNPTNSEYHRIYGQILSDEGDQEEAINSLIDALRWEPKNGYALLMMGNVYAKFKDDIITARKYYDQAIKVNPKDGIAVNNIGGNLLQQGKLDEAENYFWQALKINDSYPNTHYALAVIAETKKDLPSAFYSATKALKTSANRNELYNQSLALAYNVARKLISGGGGADHCCKRTSESLK